MGGGNGSRPDPGPDRTKRTARLNWGKFAAFTQLGAPGSGSASTPVSGGPAFDRGFPGDIMKPDETSYLESTDRDRVYNLPVLFQPFDGRI